MVNEYDTKGDHNDRTIIIWAIKMRKPVVIYNGYYFLLKVSVKI